MALLSYDPAVRDGLVAVLAADGLEVTAIASVREVAAAIERVQVLLVDLAMSDVDAVDFLRRLAASRPALPVVALGARGQDERLIAAVQAGARGCLFLDDAPARAASAAREALAGGRPLSPGMADVLLDHIRRTARPPSRERKAVRPLTERERDVLDQMARGLSYDDIGRVLGVSVNTVRSFVRVLYEKLDVNSRTEAVLVAIKLGLVRRTPYPGTSAPT